MPWGISRNGPRSRVEGDVPMLTEAARNATTNPHEQAMCDVLSDAATAIMGLAGMRRGPDGALAPADDAGDYNTNLHVSGHIDAEGGVNVYMSLTVLAPNRVATLADGATPNEIQAASEARQRMLARAAGTPGAPAVTAGQPAQPAEGTARAVEIAASTAPNAPAPNAGPIVNAANASGNAHAGQGAPPLAPGQTAPAAGWTGGGPGTPAPGR